MPGFGRYTPTKKWGRDYGKDTRSAAQIERERVELEQALDATEPDTSCTAPVQDALVVRENQRK